MNYDIQIRYSPQYQGSWEDVKVSLVRPEETGEEESDCLNTIPLDEQDKQLRLDERGSKVLALNDLCLEKDKVYKFVISLHRQSAYDPNPQSQILIDSVSSEFCRQMP